MMKSEAHSRTALFAAVALPIGFLIIYWPTLQELVNQWLGNEDYSHGLLIIPIVAYLIWQKRTELKKVEIRPDWRAFPLLLLAIFIFVVGELGAELFTTRVSMIVLIFGLVWFLCGPAVLKTLRFPLAFLFLMIPLPGLIHRNLTFPLQLFSSAGSVALLQALKVSVFREGNVIDIGTTQLQVVEACSGLRYILPLFTLGVLLAYYGQKVWWKRLLLAGAAVPIAVLANVARIGGTGLIATRWGSEAAESFFHGFSGWLVFMVCAGLYVLLNLLLHRLPGSVGAPQSVEKPSPVHRAVTWPAVLAAFIVVLLTAPAVAYLGEVSVRPLRQPLTEFPTTFHGWTGKTSFMDPKLWERVGGQDYVLIDYAKEKEGPINFYVAYYEHQKKGGDFIHSPNLCLPGAGWFIDENQPRQIGTEDPGQRGLKFNELVISKNGVSQVVYFWFQGRDRNFTSEYSAKFYLVWDGLWRRRTDGALVRLTMPLGPETTLESARRILDPFALKASRTLQEFLP
jgi:exosortase D (VPLPA-CTERM-specific)